MMLRWSHRAEQWRSSAGLLASPRCLMLPPTGSKHYPVRIKYGRGCVTRPKRSGSTFPVAAKRLQRIWGRAYNSRPGQMGGAPTAITRPAAIRIKYGKCGRRLSRKLPALSIGRLRLASKLLVSAASPTKSAPSHHKRKAGNERAKPALAPLAVRRLRYHVHPVRIARRWL